MIISNKIKNLIFDFGGVIYAIDHHKQKKTFEKFGISDFENLYSHARQNRLFADLECGKISDQDFSSYLNQLIGKNLSPQDIDFAWNSILIGFMDHAVQLLSQLKTKYNLYILSNTNAMHYAVYTRQFEEKYGFDFNSFFTKTYWSFQLGMRKPNPETYKYLIAENNFTRANTLFIDDTPANTVASEEAGLPAFLLSEDMKLEDLFDNNLEVNIKS